MNFFEKKREYLKLADEYKSLIELTVNSYRKDNMNEKISAVLNPKNELELRYAYAVLMSSIDFANFYAYLTHNDTIDMSFEDNVIIQRVIKYLLAKKNGVNPDTIIGMTPEEQVDAIFSFFFYNRYDKGKVIEYILNKTGLKYRIIDLLKIKKALKVVLILKNTENGDSSLNEKKVQLLERYANEIHRLSVKYTNKADNLPQTEYVMNMIEKVNSML